MLQECEADTEQIMHHLEASKNFFVNYHSAKGFIIVVTDAKDLADELEIKARFPQDK